MRFFHWENFQTPFAFDLSSKTGTEIGYKRKYLPNIGVYVSLSTVSGKNPSTSIRSKKVP